MCLATCWMTHVNSAAQSMESKSKETKLVEFATSRTGTLDVLLELVDALLQE